MRPLAAGLAMLAGAVTARAATTEELAYHWAPVLYQDTAVRGANVSQDYLTRVDFDGNFLAADNWQNQPLVPLPAYVYYDAVETETHWYLVYSFFHPRDWEENCFDGGCHENDLEQMRAVVEKDGSALGRLVVVDLQAHGNISSYVPPGSLVGAGTQSIDGTLSFEGSHARIYVEQGGHGPQNCGTASRCGAFPDGLGVVYRPTGVAEEPAAPDDPDVGYALLDGYAELWPRRAEIGRDALWKDPFTYEGVRLGPLGRCMGARLFGNDFGGNGTPPWGYDPPDVSPGDWLLDSAWTAALWYAIPGEESPGFLTYVSNRHLDDLVAEGPGLCDGAGCAAVGGADAGAPLALALASGLAILRRRRGTTRLPARPRR